MRASGQPLIVALFVLLFSASQLAGCVVPAEPPAGAIVPTQEATTVGSVEDARQQVGFPVLTPAWLPDGYSLVNIHVITAPNQSVQLQYRKTGLFLTRELSVVATHLPSEQRPHTQIEGSRTGREVTVRGQRGILVAAFPGYHLVMWKEGEIQFILSGYESDRVLLRIANSLQ